MKTSLIIALAFFYLACNNESTTTNALKNQTADSNLNQTISIKPSQNSNQNQFISLPQETHTHKSYQYKQDTILLNNNNVLSSTYIVDYVRENCEKIIIPQTFSLPIANEIKTITTAQNTKLLINTSDLVYENGEPLTNAVDIKITEMKNPIEMLMLQSPTVSNNKLLESGGSWNIEATSNGRPVSLKEGKTFRLQLADKLQSGFSVFYGSKSTDGSINWNESNQDFNVTNVLNEDKVGLIRGVENTIIKNKLKISWSSENNYSNYDRNKKFSYWIDVDNKQLYCDEVWDFTENSFTRRKVLDNGMASRSVEEEFNYEKFTVEQSKYLVSLLEKSTCYDRSRFFEKNSPVFYEFLSMNNKGIFQLVIDSSILTSENITFPKEMKMIILRKINNYCRTNYSKIYSQHLADIERRNIRQEIDKSTTMFADINKFGWINCDKFFNRPNELILCKTNIIHKDQTKGLAVYMVFKNINALCKAQINEFGDYAFSGVPIGEKVYVVALGSDGTNGYFGHSEISYLQKDIPITFEITKLNNDELKRKLLMLKN